MGEYCRVFKGDTRSLEYYGGLFTRTRRPHARLGAEDLERPLCRGSYFERSGSQQHRVSVRFAGTTFCCTLSAPFTTPVLLPYIIAYVTPRYQADPLFHRRFVLLFLLASVGLRFVLSFWCLRCIIFFAGGKGGC